MKLPDAEKSKSPAGATNRSCMYYSLWTGWSTARSGTNVLMIVQDGDACLRSVQLRTYLMYMYNIVEAHTVSLISKSYLDENI